MHIFIEQGVWILFSSLSVKLLYEEITSWSLWSGGMNADYI